MEPKKSWYAVLTSDVLYNKSLTDRQKILYAVIGNLANEKGYCFATNKYFEEVFDCTTRTIQKDLKTLEELGLISKIIKLNSKGEVEFRGLTPLSHAIPPLPSETTPPPVQNDATPPVQNDGYNNKVFNNKKEKKDSLNLSDSLPKNTSKGSLQYNPLGKPKDYDYHAACNRLDINGKSNEVFDKWAKIQEIKDTLPEKVFQMFKNNMVWIIRVAQIRGCSREEMSCYMAGSKIETIHDQMEIIKTNPIADQVFRQFSAQVYEDFPTTPTEFLNQLSRLKKMLDE